MYSNIDDFDYNEQQFYTRANSIMIEGHNNMPLPHLYAKLCNICALHFRISNPNFYADLFGINNVSGIDAIMNTL